MIEPPTVLGAGEILWDLLPAGRQLGGAPANVAFHAQSLGARGVVVSRVGADANGAEIRARLAALGMAAVGLQEDPGHPTGTVTVALDARGVPSYTIHTGAAWDFLEWTPALADLAARADAVCFGSLAQRAPGTRTTLRRLLGRAPRTALRLFDVNLRQAFYDRDVLDASLRASNAVKVNDEEMPVVLAALGMPHAATPEAGLDALRTRYALRAAALTRGARGSRVVTADDVSDLPGTAVAVRDTVGAGDAFAAALIAGLLRGEPLARLHRRAEALAAYVCTHPGATPPPPPGGADALGA